MEYNEYSEVRGYVERLSFIAESSMDKNVLVPDTLLMKVAVRFVEAYDNKYGLNYDKCPVPGFVSVTVAR